jgi:chromosome segregation ATPase
MIQTVQKSLVLFNTVMAFALAALGVLTLGTHSDLKGRLSAATAVNQKLDAEEAEIVKKNELTKALTKQKSDDLFKMTEANGKQLSDMNKTIQAQDNEIKTARDSADRLKKELDDVLMPRQKKLRESVEALLKQEAQTKAKNSELTEKRKELLNQLAQTEIRATALRARLAGLEARLTEVGGGAGGVAGR